MVGDGSNRAIESRVDQESRMDEELWRRMEENNKRIWKNWEMHKQKFMGAGSHSGDRPDIG